MSASVAMLMGGLPDYEFDSGVTTDFNTDEYSSHGPVRLDNEYDQNTSTLAESPARDQRPKMKVATDSEDKEKALGNLLGALIPNHKERSEDPPSPDIDRAASPITPGPATANEGLDHENEANHASRLPSFDATAANDLFTQEDLSQFNHDNNAMLDMGASHDLSGQRAIVNGMPDFLNTASLPNDAPHHEELKRPSTPQKREFAAFARLQFEDGSYYLNTYACELGRDVLAYRAALAKEREEKEAAEMNQRQGKSQSSSGKASHPSGQRRRQLGSQIQGSVVSEQGGFAGIDEPPMRPPQGQEKQNVSSQESESSVVKPAEYLINPRTMPSFDYHKSTEMQAKWTAQEENGEAAPDDEQPAAVTDAHLPDPNMCPLIPIHGKTKDGLTEAELHKKISRRHVKIQWSFGRECWEMRVQGRNGAFCDDKFIGWKGVVPLRDGSIIQIAHVQLTFRLPSATQQQQPLRQTSHDMDIDADEVLPSVEAQSLDALSPEDRRDSTSEIKSLPRLILKTGSKVDGAPPEPLLGPDGLPIVKRRGPGRPPKDGIMSTRERKEREKAAKLAAAREANGGKTPPPLSRGKPVKQSTPPTEEPRDEARPEKRKYTKRKVPEDENNGPEGDGGEQKGSGEEEPKAKKPRAQREKSESPEYPPRESLTAEQLARPTDSYAVLLYKMLDEIHPTALPLKEIYRQMKLKWPWFAYEATTEGWQSSVRHNLNSEYGKLFEKGDKEGKGFAWRSIPGVQITSSDKKRSTQAAAQRPKQGPPLPPQRPQFQQLPGQPLQWQGNGAFPANGAQPFINHGPWPPPTQANPNWPQNGPPPSNMPQQGSAPPNSVDTQGSSQMPQTPANQLPSGQSPAAAAAAPSTGSSQPPRPPPPSSGSAASNMPCTFEGILAIKRFEEEIYLQLGESSKPKEFWQPVFASAKQRVLHGCESSILPEGESREEKTIIVHMRNFVKKYSNPNFKGFKNKTGAPGSQAQTPQNNQISSPAQTPLSIDVSVADKPVVTDQEHEASTPTVQPEDTSVATEAASQGDVVADRKVESQAVSPTKTSNTERSPTESTQV